MNNKQHQLCRRIRLTVLLDTSQEQRLALWLTGAKVSGVDPKHGGSDTKERSQPSGRRGRT